MGAASQGAQEAGWVSRIGVAIGLLVALMGVVVISGWYAGSRMVVQLVPGFVPMQFNTALGFFLCGVGLSAAGLGRTRLVRVCAAVVAALGSATLVQYIWGVDFGIDQLFMEHYVTDLTSHPGRMAANTAFCFVLTGISLVGVSKPGARLPRAAAVLGAVVVALGAVSLFGYLGGLETAYRWGQWTRMAVHTAIGFIALAIGIMLRATDCIRQTAALPSWTRWMPVSAVFVTMAFSLWQSLSAAQQDAVVAETQLRADGTANAIRRDISQRIHALERIAARFEGEAAADPARVRRAFEDLLADEPSYRSLDWIDPTGQVSVRVPETAPLDEAEVQRTLVLRTPLSTRFGPAGALVASVHPEILLGDVVGQTDAGQHVEVTEGGAVLFAGLEAIDAEQRLRFAQVRDVELDNRTWRVHVWPASERVIARRTPLPWVVMVFMLLLAVLVPSVLHSATRARDEARALDAVIEGSPNGILMVDPKGRITLANARIEDIFGRGHRALGGRMVTVLIPSGLPDEGAQDGDEASDEPTVVQSVGQHRDGRSIPIELSVAPVQTPDGPQLLAAVADISVRQRAEAVAAERTADLERSNRELEQFARVASHDLQEPLRMVASYTELLQRRYKGQLDEKADRYLHHAADGARRMQQLIEDLLRMSRVHRDARPPRPVDSAEIVDQALGDLALRIETTDARVDVGPLPVVLADPTQLAQVVRNLVGNALKFAGDRPPEVTIDAERGDDGRWRFCVADAGIGFETKHADRIFSIYQRLHARDVYDGSGIGLAIVRKIIERHGGTVWAEGVPDEGARFFFTLADGGAALSVTPSEEGGT